MGRDPDGAALDALLSSAGAVDRDPAVQERVFADAWSRVHAAMDDDAPVDGDDRHRRRLDLVADRELAARRRRRAARVASVTLAVVVAGAGTAAAAEYLSTRTGEENTGWEVGAGGSGELLNAGGSDRDQVFGQATDDIPFPSTRQAARTYALAFFPRESDSLVSTSSLRLWVAGNAVCSWADAWAADDAAGDVAARAADTTSLASSLTWEPFLTFSRDAGALPPASAVIDSDYLGWLRPLAGAAAGGDRQAVLDAVADSHFCGPDVLPTIQSDPAYPLADGVR